MAAPDIKNGKGTYALVLALDEAATLAVGKLGLFSFPPGYYLYIGSAHRGLGSTYERLGRSQDAMAAYQEAVALYELPGVHLLRQVEEPS